MKNVFALDKLSQTFDGAKFIARTIGEVDCDVAQKQERQLAEQRNLEKLGSLPKWLQWLGFILFMGGAIAVLAFFDAIVDGEKGMDFATAYERAGWVLIAGAIAFAVGVVIMVLAYVRRKKVLGSSAFRCVAEKADKVLRESYEALGVPAGAEEVALLGVSYKRKNGDYWHSKPFLSNMVYVRTAVFTEDECLCFATFETVFKIPLARITGIQTVKGYVFAFGWVDDVPFNKGRYKQYRLRRNNGGMVGGKPSYKLVFRDENYEDYYVHIPCFDIEPIVRLTGKTAE